MNKPNIDLSNYLNSPAHEAFRVLSINLEFNKNHEKLKTIALVSYNPGEGKTSVALNLAIVASRSGNKVLYIDADLRKPNQLKRHGDANIIGLTDILENMEPEEIICQTNLENLDYVTTGNWLVDPVEFLSGPMYDSFMEGVSKRYDMIFLDTPSMGNYVDGAIIASKASGVLIICRGQHTSYKNMERLKWQMKNVGANMIGIVINRVHRRDYKDYFLLNNNYKFLAKKVKTVKFNVKGCRAWIKRRFVQ